MMKKQKNRKKKIIIYLINLYRQLKQIDGVKFKELGDPNMEIIRTKIKNRILLFN